MYKLGLKLWSVNESFMNEAVRLYQKGYFYYIELYAVPGSYARYHELWFSMREKYNIPFMIHAPHYAHGFNLAEKNLEYFNMEMYKETKKFADKLKAKYIIFHGGVEGKLEETLRQLKVFNEPRALIENKPYKVLSDSMVTLFCRGAKIDEVKIIIQEACSGLCFDIGHAICAANSLGKEPYEYVKEFIKLVPRMYHLTDIEDMKSEFDSHLNIGNGKLKIKKILNNLSVDAMITMETLKKSNDRLGDFIKDIDSIRAMEGKNE
jgi:endonuclease IV